jgi:hypothetical protein
MRTLQQAAALLACVQQTALYDNEPEADLSDCMLVILRLIREALSRLDQLELEVIARSE